MSPPVVESRQRQTHIIGEGGAGARGGGEGRVGRSRSGSTPGASIRASQGSFVPRRRRHRAPRPPRWRSPTAAAAADVIALKVKSRAGCGWLVVLKPMRMMSARARSRRRAVLAARNGRRLLAACSATARAASRSTTRRCVGRCAPRGTAGRRPRGRRDPLTGDPRFTSTAPRPSRRRGRGSGR